MLSPPLSLPLLAALTPRDIDVQLMDENIEPIDVTTDCDMVAISAPTASARRAYEIADTFRQRGIPVVMGGVHPSVLPDEAAQHADAVVVGEAEPVWSQVLADAGAGRLQSRYMAQGYHDLVGMPNPRRDLLKADRYLTINAVQTARGCPNACTFCSVSVVFGRRYRFRPVDEVVEELRTLGGWVGFVDDNIIGAPARARELFEALIPLKLRWIGQGDLSIAKDPELLKLAVRSGCHALFMGIESVSEENLRATHKTPNLRIDMGQAIRTIHQAGIEIVGSFVLGLEGDDESAFARTAAFAIEHKLMAAQFAVLTPFPGTEVYRQLEAEGRILDHDWSRYTMSQVVFRPKQMTPERLQEGQAATYRRFYSVPAIFGRSLTGRRNLLLRLLVNFSYRRLRHGKAICKGLPAHETVVAPQAAPLERRTRTAPDSAQ